VAAKAALAAPTRFSGSVAIRHAVKGAGQSRHHVASAAATTRPGLPPRKWPDRSPRPRGVPPARLARSLRQRCLIHRARNILAKVPAHAQDEVKAAYWAMFDIPADIPPGPERGKSCAATPSRLRRPLRQDIPGCGALPGRRPAGTDGLTALSPRALAAHPPLQLHRTHLRRDPSPRQGHRPTPR
jgi:hypothetical protein